MLVGINMLGVAPGFHTVSVYLSFVARALQSEKGGVRVRLFGDANLAAQLEGLPFSPVEDARAAAALCKEAGVEAVLSLAESPIPRCPVPQALLAFDLRPWLEPAGGGSWFGRAKPQDAAVLQKAQSVVVPSEFLHKQLLQELQVPLDRVQVAPPGAVPVLKETVPPLLEEPYLLAVGTTGASRNTERLRQLFERLKGEVPHALVVAGLPGDAEPPAWPDRVLRVERVGWDRLAALYQHAALYIHTPAYDGCGLAVLEAMAAGAPIASGRIGAVPEIAGNVPYYFNAESVESMTGVVRRALAEDPGAREKRIQAGRRATAEFTWEATAWKVLHALQRLG